MKVFLVFYGGGHVTAAIPIIELLQKRGHEVVPLALTTAAAVLSRLGIAHRTVRDYVDPADNRITQYGRKLAERHHTEGKGIPREESIAYLGASMRDLVDEIGEIGAWAAYEERGLNAFCPEATARRILQAERPDWVLATASPRMEAAALRAAHQLGIPSMCVIDLFAILELPWLRRSDNGHLLTVYSQSVVDRLVNAGRVREHIFVTGNPAFDALNDPGLRSLGAEWRQRHNVHDHEKLILWAEQPEPADPDLPRRVRAFLAEICANRADWRLIVRLHPSSTDPRGEVIPPGALHSPAEDALPVVAAAADAVVTLTSTVAMEMLLTGKPAIILRISQYDALVSYTEADGALVLDDLQQVPQGLEQVLTHTPLAQKLAAARKTLPSPGDATKRVCDLLESEHGHVLAMIRNDQP
ncbi:UDP-N-acetylglucosamine 2-epimerase [Achromobacter spanius]|uniref:UDP-N-acetylglucosamine 2-epimerase n=1 Tax=Achromobacter spanius TaxID=217203 RepID=UPI002227F5FA|nr:UDP-N-acetylglucosamine 2-epimerase [Achromobacter spanius]MCW3151053.1 UDP-N-acetylglucosamine 2-epimerase [Achromobacter spanius]